MDGRMNAPTCSRLSETGRFGSSQLVFPVNVHIADSTLKTQG